MQSKLIEIQDSSRRVITQILDDPSDTGRTWTTGTMSAPQLLEMLDAALRLASEGRRISLTHLRGTLKIELPQRPGLLRVRRVLAGASR